MSLELSRCARCGATIEGPAGIDLPTCPVCADLLRRRLQPDAQAPRTCPADGSTMITELVHQIVIDRCPACSGVWLDPGELELLQRALQGVDREPLARAVVLGMTWR